LNRTRKLSEKMSPLLLSPLKPEENRIAVPHN
jgi:hypothetical protein